jgi:hypothetical protein
MLRIRSCGSILSMQLLLALTLLFSQQADSPIADLPPAPGIYFRDNAQFRELTAAVLSGMKTKGMEQFIQTGGYMPFQTDFACNNSRAAFRITSSKPVFYVRAVGSPTDAMILRFTQKKDFRYIQASPSDATIDNKGGFKKEAIRKVKIVSFSDQSFSVAPEQSLKPGEYLLLFGGTSVGYDFGIDAK